MEKLYSFTGNPELFGVTPKELLNKGYIHIVEDGWDRWLSPNEYKVYKKIVIDTEN